MRAGKMVHVIALERPETLVNEAGSAVDTFSALATLRAELLESETEVFQRNVGDTPEPRRVFRTRWIAGIKTNDAVVFRGARYRIKELVEIGRRRGLELRCIEMEAGYQRYSGS